jgi:hypothetical protein
VGAEWTASTVTVILDPDYATIVSGDQLVRHLRIDRTRFYQTSG